MAGPALDDTTSNNKASGLPSPEIPISSSPLCQRCSSKKVWRDGYRYPIFGEKIQRWLCRECGTKFSDPLDVEKSKVAVENFESIESKELKSLYDKDSISQICVTGMKNLVTEPATKLVVPQKREYDIKDLKGAVVEFLYYLENNEKAPSTKSHYIYSLDFLINNGANLFDPLSVKKIFTEALKDKTDARKYCLLKAYKAFTNAYGIDVSAAQFKKYKPTRGLPYIPPEAHMDVLSASCSYEMAAYLQTLKETAARPIEAMRIQRSEIDFLQNHLPINHPAKNCNPRIIRMTDKLANMLKALPINTNG